MRDTGDIVVLPRVADVAGVPPIGNLANVVPFRRPKTAQSDAPPCIVDPAERPTPPARGLRSLPFSLAVAATVLLHGAAFAAFFYYQPPPLASIGVEAISVEIVVGSNSLAGDTDPNSKSNVDSSYAPPEEKVADTPTREEALNAPEKPVEQLAAAEPAPQPLERPKEQPKAEVAPQPPQEQPKEEPVVALAPDMPETVQEPPKVEIKPEVKPVETKPVETKPAETKPVETKRETPKPAARKPVEKKREAATRKRGESEKKTQVAAATPSDPSVAAKGFGIGRSDAVSNYPGIVRAHLMRFLPSARDSYNTSATVVFTVSSSGSVVSSRLSRPSGNGAADAAVQGMVSRASPFPAPGPSDKREFQITVNLR